MQNRLAQCFPAIRDVIVPEVFKPADEVLMLLPVLIQAMKTRLCHQLFFVAEMERGIAQHLIDDHFDGVMIILDVRIGQLIDRID